MSIETPERPVDDAVDLSALTRDDDVTLRPDSTDDTEEATSGATDEAPPVNPLTTSVAAFLATASAAWVVGGLFTGIQARLVGILGGLIGAGFVALAHRGRRGAALQYFALPLAMVVGAVLVIPDATGGTANLVSLVKEAITSGGLGSPPVPFDPGWRFLVVVVMALLGITSASLAISFNRPRLAVVVAVPLIAGGMLLQPAGTETATALVALVLAIGGMSVSFGAQLGRDGETGSKFELRRLARAGAILTALVLILGAVSQIGFLFPETKESNIIPPKRPENPPPQADRVIFTVKADRQVPWRLGVLDVYGLDELAWLTPPYDPARFVDVPDSGEVPADLPDSVALPSSPDTLTTTFRVEDIQGRVLPDVANTVDVDGTAVQWDPRTQSLRLDGRARAGTEYTVTSVLPPSARQLNAAPSPSSELNPYLEVPEPPQVVREILSAAPPESKGRYERLQFVRTTFFSKIVAAGPGKPVDVGPDTVAEMLLGREASPYEITAAEALMARWAGVPARIGYGYYTGDEGATKNAEGAVEIRPKDGSTWLEVYFEGHGWVPIVGRPPKAKASTSTDQKNNDPKIKPSTEIALVVYVPLQASTITLLYTIVTYWLIRAVPVVLAFLLLYAVYPALLKRVRRTLRARWAAAHGPRARIGVAYAELRDVCNDFGVGHPSHTPIQLLDSVAPDKEHRELAWLVTRTIWGDLVRDVRVTDADTAEDMARSVRRRIVRAQPPLMRALAATSRVSLRDPYTAEIPNPWLQVSPLARARRWTWRTLRSVGRRARQGVRVPRPQRVNPGLGVLVIVMAGLLSGCAQTLDLSAPRASDERLNTPKVPSTAAGLRIQREPDTEVAFTDLEEDSLVTDGRVYSIHQGSTIQGSLQIAWFKPTLQRRLGKVKQGLLNSLEGGHFSLQRVGEDRLYVKQLAEATLYVWFPDDERYYQLFVARNGFDAKQFIVSTLAFQQGRQAIELDRAGAVPFEDPRLGSSN